MFQGTTTLVRVPGRRTVGVRPMEKVPSVERTKDETSRVVLIHTVTLSTPSVPFRDPSPRHLFGVSVSGSLVLHSGLRGGTVDVLESCSDMRTPTAKGVDVLSLTRRVDTSRPVTRQECTERTNRVRTNPSGRFGRQIVQTSSVTQVRPFCLGVRTLRVKLCTSVSVC